MSTTTSTSEAAAPAPARQVAELSAWTLLRVFTRSLFLQASWNPQGMQNLGLAYALFPALKRLYPEKERQMAAVRRHLVFFNTHPYVAAAIVGGVLFHEEKIARGEEKEDRVVAFKAALMGPLAALGDGFFWLSLKPAVGAFCAALVPVIHAWAALLFLVLYNFVHLFFRARFYSLGLRFGDRLVDEIARAKLPQRGARLRAVAAAAAGALAGYLAVLYGMALLPAFGVPLALGCLLTGGVTYVLVSRGVSNLLLLYLAAALAVLAGAIL